MASASLVFVFFESAKRGYQFGIGLRGFTTMLIILLIAWIYLLVLLYDTLATKNIYQALALPLYAIVIIVLLSVEVAEISNVSGDVMRYDTALGIPVWTYSTTRSVSVAKATVTGVLVFGQTVVAWQLRKYFGGAIFEHLDADVTRRKYFLWVQVSQSSRMAC